MTDAHILVYFLCCFCIQHLCKCNIIKKYKRTQKNDTTIGLYLFGPTYSSNIYYLLYKNVFLWNVVSEQWMKKYFPISKRLVKRKSSRTDCPITGHLYFLNLNLKYFFILSKTLRRFYCYLTMDLEVNSLLQLLFTNM